MTGGFSIRDRGWGYAAICHIPCHVVLSTGCGGGALAILDVGHERGKGREERTSDDRGLAGVFRFPLFPVVTALGGYGAEVQGSSFGLGFART